MKFLLFTILILQVSNNYGQTQVKSFYLGQTEEIAKTEIETHETSAKIERVFDSEGELCLTWRNEILMSRNILSFTKKSDNWISSQLCMIPDTEIIFNEWIKSFNKVYIPISETEWRYYSGSAVFKIEVKYNEVSDKFGVYFSILKMVGKS